MRPSQIRAIESFDPFIRSVTLGAMFSKRARASTRRLSGLSLAHVSVA